VTVRKKEMASKKAGDNALAGAGCLTVTVLRAKDLAAMDDNGKSDPFVKITASFCGQTFQTHTIKKTLEPVWNESFPLFVGALEPNASVTLNLFDRDLIGADFLGCVTVPMAKLLSVDTDFVQEWFTLEKEPTKTFNKGPKNPATIELKFHYPKNSSLQGPGIIKRENPKKYYKFDKVLGQGAFGEVRRAVHKQSKKAYAVKILKKAKLDPTAKKVLEREIAVMSKLQHPNIVSLIEAFDTTRKTYLILELVSGGELFDEIISKDEPYYEKDAADIVRQVLLAIRYMNSMGIAHRDLKPENLLLDDDHNIKISDFGLSKDFSNEDMTTSCGTATYVAPEVLTASGYDVACDIWSVGVITYILLSGHVPFDGPSEEKVFEKILEADYSFPSPLWDPVSEEAKDFISKIFVVEPKQRMSVTDCLDHDWLAETKVGKGNKLASLSQSTKAKVQKPKSAGAYDGGSSDSEHDD